MKKLLFALMILLLPALAHAQAIDKYTTRIYNQGAANPLSTTDHLAANVVCNQVAPVGSSINPTKEVWDDILNPGKVCIYTDPGTGELSSVPFGGSYEATLTATNIAGTSPESTRAPFTRPGFAPAAPTGYHPVR